MKIPTRHNSNNGLASQEKLEERESWHKLVVKVIIWNEGTDNKNVTTPTRITRLEWARYCQQIIKTNLSYSKKRVLSDLELTLEKIKQNGGFEE